jgi:hypothetical protein
MINRLALKTLLDFQQKQRVAHSHRDEFVLVARICSVYVVKRAKLMPNKDAHFLRFNKAGV